MVSYPAALKMAGRQFSIGFVIPDLTSFFVFLLPPVPCKCQTVRPVMIILREGEHTAPDIEPM